MRLIHSNVAWAMCVATNSQPPAAATPNEY